MTAMTVHYLVRLVVIALVVQLAAPAMAATKRAHKGSTQRARKEFRLGKKAAELGHFESAITHFERSYELERVPAVLFNIGQCHRYLKHYDRALYFFEEYLREEPQAVDRAVVQADIVDTKRERDSQAPPPPEPATTPHLDEPSPVAETAVADTDPVAISPSAAATTPVAMNLDAPEAIPTHDTMSTVMTAPAPQSTSAPLWSKWWVWAAAGGVAAVAVTAIVLTKNHDKLIEPAGSLGTADAR